MRNTAISEESPGGRLEQIHRELFDQTHAMWRYATSNGLSIDPVSTRHFADAAIRLSEDVPLDVDRSRGNSESIPTPDLLLESLRRAHAGLSKIVAPALPKTVLFLDEQSRRTSARRRYFKWLGPVPIVRVFVTLTIFALIAFVLLISLTPQLRQEVIATPAGEPEEVPVQDETAAESPSLDVFVPLDNGVTWITASDTQAEPTRAIAGQAQGVFALFLAAFLGVMFSLLWKIYEELERGVYSPQDDSYYVISVLLGLLAGVILSLLIPLEEIGGIGVALTKPTLALLGGFSAAVVHHVLTTLVESVKGVFAGSTEERFRAQLEAERSLIQSAGDVRDAQVLQELTRLESFLTDDPVGKKVLQDILVRLGT